MSEDLVSAPKHARTGEKKSSDTILPGAGFPVVAIGASAGGSASIEQFFRSISAPPGAAFVVIQHPSPGSKRVTPESLANTTCLTVTTAVNERRIEPNTIYLPPPRSFVTINKQVLTFVDTTQLLKPRQPIDVFFTSLAQDVKEWATAVVLSNTGSDGVSGLRAIAEHGGCVYVESPQNAEFGVRPNAASATELSHGHGSPADIAVAIFGERIAGGVESSVEHGRPPDDHDGRDRIFKAIEDRYGVDFSRYNIATVNRRIDRRLTELNLAAIWEYWMYIQDHPAEVTTLYYEILIGVTKFFRDREAFESVRREVARIIDEKQPGDEVRVWSAGCASGEETYSLAILFSEEIKRSGKRLELKLFATDIDDEMLTAAAAGAYRKEQMADVSDHYSARYFKQSNGVYRVVPSLRSLVVFARHNVMNDPPFTNLDLIACRNLLIYLDGDTQRQVLSLFYFSLNPRAVLFLGPSESLGSHETGYDAVHSKWRIYSKSTLDIPQANRVMPTASENETRPAPVHPSLKQSAQERETPTQADVDRVHHALLEQYVPSGLLVDEQQRLIHVYGEPPFDMAFSPGKVSNKLNALMDKNLCAAISVCMECVKRERRPVGYSNYRMEYGGQNRSISFTVTPVLPDATGPITFFLVSVGHKDSVKSEGGQDRILSDEVVNIEQVSVLEDELQVTKERLQVTIKELERTNEALQSANEMLLFSNEDLQTTNEKLHAVNQELYSVNAEYQTKISELNRLSLDEAHLFSSTGVGTIFIDDELCVRKFTPAAAERFNLLDQDHGRPFSHVTHKFEGVNFNQLVEQCLLSKEVIEAEVKTTDGESHIVKLSPYENDATEFEGVVISFVSIQAVKQAERLYEDMFHSSPVGIVSLTANQDILSINPSLRRLLGYTHRELIGQPLSRLFTASQETVTSEAVASYLDSDIAPNEFEQIATTVVRKDGAEIPVEISITLVPSNSGILMHLFITDMTDRQAYLNAVEVHRDELEQLVDARTKELKQRDAQYEDLYEHSPVMHATIDAVTMQLTQCNARLALLTGYSKDELVGMSLSALYHDDSRGEAERIFRVTEEAGQIKSQQTQLRSKNGERIPVLLNMDAVYDDHHRFVYSRCTWIDVRDVCFLQKENQTLVMATHGSQIGVWDWHFDTNEQTWSRKFHELLGYDEGDTVNVSFDSRVVHPNDRIALANLFREHFSGQKRFDAQVRLETKGGEYRWFRLQGKAVRDREGRVVRMVGTAQDVHAARTAQEELKSNTDILSFISQETNDGWWDWRLQDDHEYISPRFWETFGYDPKTKRHHPSEWQAIIHPNDLQPALDGLRKHIQTGGEHPYLQELRYQHADGHWVTVLCRGRVIEWDAKGDPVRMVGVHTDLSQIRVQEQQLKKINEQLARSNQDLEQFAYITSHDLKAPLRGITTLVDLIEEDLLHLSAEHSPALLSAKSNLQRVSRQAARMEELIRGVLDYSRVDSVDTSAAEEVNVRELLMDMAIDYRLDVGSQLVLGERLPILHTNSIMIEQVFGNLISNSIKHHSDPDHLVIDIDARQQGGFYRFSVRDNGPGIDPKHHKRIFDMFQTVHNKDSYESTGIGLTMVKRIIEKFDGTIRVDSTEGNGSTFRFDWPLS
ncbi:MAG: PAS domain S-box protein [Pseudomonadota bacterium]